jgi:hypothetical protein
LRLLFRDVLIFCVSDDFLNADHFHQLNFN